MRNKPEDAAEARSRQLKVEEKEGYLRSLIAPRSDFKLSLAWPKTPFNTATHSVVGLPSLPPTSSTVMILASTAINKEIVDFIGGIEMDYTQAVGSQGASKKGRYVSRSLLGYLRDYDCLSTEGDLLDAHKLVQQEMEAESIAGDDDMEQLMEAYKERYISNGVGNADSSNKAEMVSQLIVLTSRYDKLVSRIEKISTKLSVTTQGYEKRSDHFETQLNGAFDEYNLTVIECESYEDMQRKQNSAVGKRLSDLRSQLKDMEELEKSMQRKYAHLQLIGKAHPVNVPSN
jgi:hypothetical protein